ncbi:PTS sugar transporter subunit IIA [Ligilactobacillus saerimneri]|uniref:PTS sugar transporter subunit IIA n=1 Tax=Ligilactobacillus saerimneri TaxID=228229 RepID=UPI003F291CCF
MQIVVTGHGNFATGIASTVQLLAGNVSGVQYVDFTADMNEETLTNKLQETLTQDQGTVFFCDLLGGTPYKQAATLKAMHPDQDIAVVCGCNVASLLENALMGLDQFANSHDLAAKIVTTAQAGIREFGVSSRPAATARPVDEEEDGI